MIVNKEYRILRSRVRNRYLYTVRACSIDVVTGEIVGYDANSTISGVSPEHLKDLLKDVPTRLIHNKVIDEEKLKEHLNIAPAQAAAEPKLLEQSSPVYTHKDVAKFTAETPQEEVILNLYHMSLSAIQDISRLRKKSEAGIIQDVYDLYYEELLIGLLEYENSNENND